MKKVTKKYKGAIVFGDIRTPEQKFMMADYDAMMKKIGQINNDLCNIKETKHERNKV